ncbi:MAG TPA: 2Fe-2S iron-sulfur cluster binding domain-containing protein [Gammaproteobacteria bacterium]|nr:2Fe-2S iron-sulfur cluster binding domain-containing protein [Gammaproteobacteria bacterium]
MFGKLFKRDNGPFKLRIEGVAEPIEVDNKTFLLTAALDAGIPIPYSCRVGGCGTCKVRLLDGKVKEYTDKTYLLTPEQLQQNYILSCQAVARSDLSIAVDDLDLTASAEERITRSGRISAVAPLTHDILQLTIELDGPLSYRAGQYADLTVPGVIAEHRSYSFAGRPEPGGNRRVVFHVRKVLGGAFTEWLHGGAREGTELTVAGPGGDFWLRPNDAPMLCVAGGSGMAPLKALLEQAVVEGVQRDCTYLYGARTQQDLYCEAEMAQIAEQWQGRFEFVPVLSEEPEDSDWPGRRGLVTAFLQEGGRNLSEYHAYMCGPPPMLDAAIAELQAQGIGPANIHFDKFLDKSHAARLSA